jgi:hypothetical protein
MALLTDQQLEDYINGVPGLCAPVPSGETWTAIVCPEWDRDGECSEEIDVPARDRKEARERVLQVLEAMYNPGLTILHLEPLVGFRSTFTIL